MVLRLRGFEEYYTPKGVKITKKCCKIKVFCGKILLIQEKVLILPLI